MTLAATLHGRCLTPALLLLIASPALPQEPKAAPAPTTSAKDAKDKDQAEKEPPLPADAHAAQTIQLDGKNLSYQVGVGTLPVYDNGKKSGEVVFTAYTMDGKERPVTFALNGGPGAASVYLNLGAIGPKHLQFGEQGDSPSDPATLDRQSRHLAGFYRPRLHRPHRHRLQPFAGLRRRRPRSSSTRTDADIHYLSRIIL